MRTKHTPGPWKLQAGRSIVTPSGAFYLTYGQDKYGNPNFKDFCELDRNAQLIAASPKLLERLMLACEALRAKGEDGIAEYCEIAVREAVGGDS
jgi:hypothetical protein